MIYAATSQLTAGLPPARKLTHYLIYNTIKQAVSDQSVGLMVFYNDKFHYQIGEMADNPYTSMEITDGTCQIGQTFWRSGPDGATALEACKHHDEFIDIFASHDEEAAVELTLAHWALSRKKWMNLSVLTLWQ